MSFLLCIGTADPVEESAVILFKRADKPSSVIRFPEWMTIYLGHWLPNASCSQPERDNEAGHLIRSYLALLQMGFTMPCLSPNTRWALTPPFHPCPQCLSTRWRSVLCCTFRRVTPPGRYPAFCPVELGLSSPIKARSSGSLIFIY